MKVSTLENLSPTPQVLVVKACPPQLELATLTAQCSGETRR
ncbi:hypothetical protein [Microseira wollei]|nr:hypothetical protein [Microseira wollei]